MAVIYKSTIEKERQLVSEKTFAILREAGEKSKNPHITICSTIRTPISQAAAMYDNLKKGNKIRYKAPGREVESVFNECVTQKMSRSDTIGRMVERIEKLALNEQRVSKHCVSVQQYHSLNVLDISLSIPNPRDFVKALVADPSVVCVITPYASDYNSSKASVDVNEPAIHIEIKQ